MADKNEKKPRRLFDRVRRWIEELVDDLVGIAAPEPTPVPAPIQGRPPRPR